MSAVRIPVLMYHRIGPSHNARERRFCVTPKQFAQHMQLLADKGYQACSCDEFIGWLRGDITLPDKSFHITFDDGYMGVYEHALPVLHELGWPATMFLVSGLIGGSDIWCQKENHSSAGHPLVGLSEIEAMQKNGFCFYSHSRSHADLTALSDQALQQELRESKADLESLLGIPAPFLAYPYGRYDEHTVKAAQAAGYEAAFATRSGFNRIGQDPFRIRRIDVFGTDTPRQLLRKITLGANDGSLTYSVRYYIRRILARFNSPAL